MESAVVTETMVYSDGPAVDREEVITLYAVDGRSLGEFPLRKMLANQNVTVIWSKSGVARRAVMKVLTCHIRPVLSSAGQCFEQNLPSGRVFALRGVRGSEPE